MSLCSNSHATSATAREVVTYKKFAKSNPSTRTCHYKFELNNNLNKINYFIASFALLYVPMKIRATIVEFFYGKITVREL